MKHVLFVLSLGALQVLGGGSAFAASSPASNSFTISGQTFFVNRLGRSRWVSPATLRAHATLDPSIRAPDCASIEGELRRDADLLADCQGSDGKAMCSLLRKRIRLVAENRPEAADTPIDIRPRFRWSLGWVSVPVSEASVRAAVARSENVSEDSVFLSPVPSLRLSQAPVPAFASDSLIQRVAPLVGFSSTDLIQVENGQLVSRNALAACDLQAGRLNLRGPVASEIQYTERVPDSVVETTWKAYEQLQREAIFDGAGLSTAEQAAEIGSFVANALPELVHPADSALRISLVFRHLVDQSEAGLRLKEFASSESLRREEFSDQSYDATVQADWSLQ